MRNAETTLAIINDRGRRGLSLDRVYRQLFNEDLYLRGYGRLYRNQGAMTTGATEETVDGMSRAKIAKTIALLRDERFRWTPGKRTLIPKSNGKMRPLGIPTWTDKLLQEVVRSILEAYYEPQFSSASHGFRPGRGCHTALKNIFHAWVGTTWFIEGDIKGCFDNIDHTVLLAILREKLDDGRLLTLIEGLLKAGYLEEWTYRPTLSGTPQGGIISPLLANIYLDKLDKFVEQTLIPGYTRGISRRKSPAYTKVSNRIQYLKKRGADSKTLQPLHEELYRIRSSDPMDPGYRRLRYIRYADDFLLGFAGPREEAEEIKNRIGEFLRDHLKLELSPEKTLITHAGTEKAQFLGYEIGTNTYPGIARGNVDLRLPAQKLEAKIAKYQRNGKPVHRSELINDSDFDIVARYGSEYQGFVQYYGYAQNRFWLNHLRYVMELSMLRTLASKHKTSVAVETRKYQSEVIDRGRKMRCYEVVVERPGKDPLTARFGGLRLTPEPFLIIEDRPLDFDRWITRNELIARLQADECELCGSNESVQVHHVRKLSDLAVKGRRTPEAWKQVMSARRRKTLVVCLPCHTNIHAGRPTRTRKTQGVPTDE